jgi:hypothetical protein
MSLSQPGWHLFAPLLFATIALSPAWAQETGSHIKTYEPAIVPDSVRISDADRARITFDAYAACLMQRRTRALKEALDLPVDDPAYIRTVDNLAVDECLSSGRLKFNLGLLRGGFYIALYRKEFLRKDPPLGNAPLFPYSDITGVGSMQARQHSRMVAVADCAVRKDPIASRAFVMGPTASRQEAAALAALQPSLAACVQPGVNILFFKPMLSGLIAEALYRESVAASPLTEIAKVVH